MLTFDSRICKNDPSPVHNVNCVRVSRLCWLHLSLRRMFENAKPDAKVKLIDFGLAAAFRKNQFMTERVGTVYTMSPEVMDGIYTSKADLWSVGVVSYMLMSGIKPFWGSTRKEVIDAVRRGKYNFKGKAWKNRSQEGKDFISALLEKDPNKRLSASQALKHKWLASETVLSSQKPDLKAMGDAQAKLVQYAESGEFKKLVLNVIAKKSTPDDIMELRDMFNEFDSDNDGTITLDEFKTAMSKSNLSAEEIEIIFNKMVSLYGFSYHAPSSFISFCDYIVERTLTKTTRLCILSSLRAFSKQEGG